MRNVNTLKLLYDASPSKIKNFLLLSYMKTFALIGILSREAAMMELKKNSTKCKSIDDYIDLAFSSKFNPLKIKQLFEINIRPLQIRWELLQLMKILVKLTPEVVLEIGTANGGTLYLWTKVSRPDATLISIDLPEEPFGGGVPGWKIPIYQSFGSAGQKIRLIRSNSHEKTTLREVEKILDKRKVDFLFIDGDHSYDGVKRDFRMYGKFVRKGGVIAFHDICPGPPEKVHGVPKLWNEIKQNFRHAEIVEDWNQGNWGIGVIYVE
jgi:predicted O-methyltransferase YrrM